MGNRSSCAATCCAGIGESGTLVVREQKPQATRRRPHDQADEASARADAGFGEEDIDVVEMCFDDPPETSHPVGVNTFDKLTHIHAQIHIQLAKQEALIQKLLQDGEGLDAALDDGSGRPK